MTITAATQPMRIRAASYFPIRAAAPAAVDVDIPDPIWAWLRTADEKTVRAFATKMGLDSDALISTLANDDDAPPSPNAPKAPKSPPPPPFGEGGIATSRRSGPHGLKGAELEELQRGLGTFKASAREPHTRADGTFVLPTMKPSDAQRLVAARAARR